MKNNFQIVTAFTLFFSSSPVIQAAEETPETPRTSAFRKFTRDIAEEKGNVNYEKKENAAIIELHYKENFLVGTFPAETKLSLALEFIKNIYGSTPSFPVIFSEEQEAKKLIGTVEDAPNFRFIYAEMPLPLSILDAEVAPAPVLSTEEKKTKFQILLKRLENFASKALQDAEREGKRLEGFVQKAGDDTEKTVQKAGKDIEAAGQKTGREAKRIVNQVKKLF